MLLKLCISLPCRFKDCKLLWYSDTEQSKDNWWMMQCIHSLREVISRRYRFHTTLHVRYSSFISAHWTQKGLLVLIQFSIRKTNKQLLRECKTLLITYPDWNYCFIRLGACIQRAGSRKDTMKTKRERWTEILSRALLRQTRYSSYFSGFTYNSLICHCKCKCMCLETIYLICYFSLLQRIFGLDSIMASAISQIILAENYIRVSFVVSE